MKSARLSILAGVALACSAGIATAQPYTAPAGATPSAESETQFQRAMALRATGDYEESIKLFQSILSGQPALNRARLELAVAYFQSLDFTRAKAEAEKVLADPTTPENVKANVRQFLASVESESKPHVFTPYISLGYGRDSNVNVGPSSDTINVGGASLTLVPGATKRSDNYYQVNAGLSHRYLFPTTLTLAGRSTALLWNSNANFYRNKYESLGNFDLDVVSLSTGPAILSQGRFRGGITMQYDDIYLGHSRLAQYSGVTPSLTLIFGKTEVTFDGVAQKRQFSPVGLTGRSSRYGNLGVTLSHTLASDKLGLVAGYHRFDEHADTARFSNKGDDLFAGATFRPWDGGTLYYRYSEKKSDYKDVEPVFNVARSEREKRHVVGVTHKFSSGFAREWVVGASASMLKNRSNVSIYTYDRDQVGVTVSRAF